ncbi:MAG TPA: redoxin domain-containing protein [Bacteroidales bacterium]|nr:redoxin domain-containing protein [Bacteroidales bacterium]
MKKILSVSIFLLAWYTMFSKEYTVSLTLPGFNGQQAYVAQINGDMSYFVDTVTADLSGTFRSVFTNQSPVGMYSFVLPQLRNAEVFFIFNKENVRMRTEITQLQNVLIEESEENRLYYAFIRHKQLVLGNAEILEYTFDHYTGSKYLEVTKQEYLQLLASFSATISDMRAKSQGLFVDRIIGSSLPILPPTLVSEQEKKAYQIAHFFDGVDFSDTLLCNTNIFTTACITYLGLFSDQYQKSKNNTVFMQAVDVIVSKTKPYPTTHDFVVNYLLNGFETMGAQDVLQYISAKYLQDRQCVEGQSKTTLQRKALNNTELAIGKTVPHFSFTSLQAKSYTQLDVAKGTHIIVFWASWCGHCTQMLPAIVLDYAKKKDPGYSLITVSLDSVLTDYKQFTSGIPEWNKTIQVCDTKQWEGQLAQAFYVFATPTIFIIQDGVIVAKPIEYDDYIASMKKLGLL